MAVVWLYLEKCRLCENRCKTLHSFKEFTANHALLYGQAGLFALSNPQHGILTSVSS